MAFNIPKIIQPFLNQQVLVEMKDGIKLQGLLICVDRSGHGGALGNLVLRSDNGDYSIVRGGTLRLIVIVSNPEAESSFTVAVNNPKAAGNRHGRSC